MTTLKSFRSQLLLCFLIASPTLWAKEPPVPQWGRFDLTLASGTAPSPETRVAVEFTSPKGRKSTISAFWDGGGSWRARFMPDEEGRWRYESTSDPMVEGLSGMTGEFECRRSRNSPNRFLRHGRLRLSQNRRHLQHADGTPFFWLGDTVWNGALLSREEDWKGFLDDRVSKNFTAIQFVMTSPWRTAPANLEGQVAFTGREKVAINPRFFDWIDARMDAIHASGLLAVPVLLWAIRGEDNPGHFLPEDQAIRLERYMTARYGAHHVVWIPAGDANYGGEVGERWKRIGRAVFDGPDRAPTVMHPGGMQWPLDIFINEPWLDLFGYQSGHGDDARTLAWIHSGPASRDWKRTPVRPILNLEPPYEDHVAYQSKKPHSAYNVRRAAYWSLFSTPVAGLTYGAHGIWSWETAPKIPLAHPNTGVARPWREAMGLEGSVHMKHLARFFGNLPWWELLPDAGIVTQTSGADDPARRVSAMKTESGRLVILYLPVGGEVFVNAEAARMGGEWYDPRTGRRSKADPAGPGKFRAPDDQDWLLTLRN